METAADNRVMELANAFLNQSNQPIFLTGKAGTGKTTFLKQVKNSCRKNVAIVAPTGVAAINAGGMTIHSFFQLPFGPFIPGRPSTGFAPAEAHDKHQLLGKLKFNAERRDAIRALELLIIDEISMVRCDVLDSIDTVMRHLRQQPNKPFGGVQVLYIGDLYQLPPVVKDEEWQLLSGFYPHPFFFSSQVCREHPPVYIELEKVYRQTDLSFITILNKVRDNAMDAAAYELLHSRLDKAFMPTGDRPTITLTTHNAKADAINTEALKALPGSSSEFRAAIDGEFYERSFPAEETLQLKEGAQVMFIKNDTEKVRRYFNGKIGRIRSMETDKIIVECEQDAAPIEVRREKWTNIKYSLDKTSGKLEEEELGSFTQFPLRLAWAITIHKSQGLTFDHAVIDAESAFAPGQVYVALSRCRSLEGLTLKSAISQRSLQSDARIIEYAKSRPSLEEMQGLLEAGTIQYQQDCIIEMLSFGPLNKSLQDVFDCCEKHPFGNLAKWKEQLQLHAEIYEKYSSKFHGILRAFFEEPILPEKHAALNERLIKAIAWFTEELKGTRSLLLSCPANSSNRQQARELDDKMKNVFDLLQLKLAQMESASKGFNAEAFQQAKLQKKEAFNFSSYAGRSSYIPENITHPGLYLLLKEKRDALAAELDLPLYLVANTEAIGLLANGLPKTSTELGKIKGFGPVKIRQFGKAFLEIINNYAGEHGLESAMEGLVMTKTTRKKSVSNKPDTKLLSYDLYMNGKSIADIATERNLAQSTIEGHLSHYVENGTLPVDRLVSAEKIQQLRALWVEQDQLKIQEIKDRLPALSYAEIHWMISAKKFEEAKA